MIGGTAWAENCWYLVGYVDSDRRRWRTVIQSLPLRIGRERGADLFLYSSSVSHRHAEIFERDGVLHIRDLGSTNGTCVNGDRVEGERRLELGDTIHFADLPFRLNTYSPPVDTDLERTRALDSAELPVHLLGLRADFSRLMESRLIRPYFQAVKALDSGRTLGHEVLSRGTLGGVETVPMELFFLAENLGQECELSQLCRHVGVEAARLLPGSPLFFLNTHPGELQQIDELIESLSLLRREGDNVRLVIEIHESAITEPEAVLNLRSELENLDILLAFDDFGTGQSRLLEIGEAPPHYLKFDMRLIRDLHQAPPERYRFLEGLVETAKRVGTTPIAEGIESKAERDACREVGFDLAQGFFLSVPRPVEV